jgi:hypothetical protein
MRFESRKGQNEEKWKKKTRFAIQNCVFSLLNRYKENFLGIKHSSKTRYNMVMVFFQFCDIENLANFSKIFPVFLLGKQQNISQKNTEYVQKFSNNVFLSDYK